MSSTDPAPGPGEDNRSLGEIVGDIASDLTSIVRSELELAKTEAKQEATRAGKAGGMFAGAAVAGHFVLLFLSLFVMFLLDMAMDTAWAALIVTGVWALIAAVLAVIGRNKAKEMANPMQHTQKTLKEDVQWATNRT